MGTIVFLKKKSLIFFYQRKIIKSLSENSQAFQGLIIFLNTQYRVYIYVIINENKFLNIFYIFGAQTYILLILDRHVGRMTCKCTCTGLLLNTNTQHKTLNLDRVTLISHFCVTTQFENLRTLNSMCRI